ncbi:MAG: 2-C-methyl-D-erythritol 2,4-cyclodiphosphate synthase [Gammaproteobacteria bacterium]|nr:2-C-methyl-D-erythritol 2,4-cyclodiphosphate synthase [Gammaproteobacteria bacterium]
MSYRIGHGFDVHAFGDGDAVVLGGVRIAHERGLLAHSDGDVALHALCDALLGAAGLGDIGQLFPDSEPAYADADSRALLRDVVERVAQLGLIAANADLTLICQAPRLAPHREAMQRNIAADLGIDPARVNVKATTTEGLGYLGRGEGIAAHAVVLLHGRT